MNLDKKDVDRSVNIVVRTGRSHHLLDIGRRDIYNGLRPIVVGFLIDNGHPRDRNRRLVVGDPKTVAARHPYFGKLDDCHGVNGRSEARSAGPGRLWFG